MADKKADDILEEMKSAQETLIEANRQKYQAEKTALAAQAQSGADTQSAGAAADYQNYILPNYNANNIQADAISRLALNKGVLSQTNQAGGYNAYRSRLAAAARQAQNAKDQLDLSYNLYDKQADAAKTNAGANYNSLKNSDYWKQTEWDYQLAANKKAEEEARKAAATYILDKSTNNTDITSTKQIGHGSVETNKTADIPLEQRGDFMVEYKLIKNAVKKATKNGTQQASETDRDSILNSAWASGWFKKSDLYDLEKELGWG